MRAHGIPAHANLSMITLFQGGSACSATRKHLTDTKLNSQMDLALLFHHARPSAFSFSPLPTEQQKSSLQLLHYSQPPPLGSP